MLRTWLLVLVLVFCSVDLLLIVDARKYHYYEEADKYYKFHRKPLKWRDAIEACLDEEANLAMPQNAEEHTVLAQIFNSYPPGVLHGVGLPEYTLLAFHDQFQEGEFLTLDGSTIRYDFQRWTHGQPSGGTGENCGAMDRAGGYHDFPCSHPSTFICEKQGVNVTSRTSDPRCFTGDVEYRYVSKLNKCIKIHNTPKVWGMARQICRAEGGNLALLRNAHDESYFKNYLQNWIGTLNHVHHRDNMLLGFHDLFRDQDYWTVRGTPLSHTGYVVWKPGSPNGGAGEGCGSLWKDGGLDDVNCNTPMIFACELDVE